jgi:hypothetical protein
MVAVGATDQREGGENWWLRDRLGTASLNGRHCLHRGVQMDRPMKMLEGRNKVAMMSNGRGVAGEDIQCKGDCCVAVGSEQQTP